MAERFVKLEDWRLQDALDGRVSKAALLTYLVLRTWARTKAKAWPSNRTIARKRGIGVSGIQAHIAMLEGASWVTRTDDGFGKKRVFEFPGEPPDPTLSSRVPPPEESGLPHPQTSGAPHPETSGPFLFEPEEVEPEEVEPEGTSSPCDDGTDEFIELWTAWRKAGGRLTSKKKTKERWVEAQKYKSHTDACKVRGKCECPLEVVGPADLLARGLRYLEFQDGDPTYIANLAAWLNPDPPGDRPVRFTNQWLDRLIGDAPEPPPEGVTGEPKGDLW